MTLRLPSSGPGYQLMPSVVTLRKDEISARLIGASGTEII
jgi:hypothetical protein